MFVFSFIVGGVGLFMERGGQAILFPACGGRCEDDVFKIQTKSRTKAENHHEMVETVDHAVREDVHRHEVQGDVANSARAVEGTKPPITILIVTFDLGSLRQGIVGKLRFAGIIIDKTVFPAFR